MNDSVISSVYDALHLLQVVAAHPDSGLSELARLSGLNKSRTYRMLCTLAQKQLVHQDSRSGRYALGYGALVLGQAARSQVDVVKAADAVADELMVRFNENLQLRIVEGWESVQIWRRVSSQSLQVRSGIGNRRRLGLGAAGKVLLAFAPPEQAAAFFRLPECTVSVAEIDRIRAQGYAVSQGELTEGVCAFAAPVFNGSGECVACLSLSAPQSRTDEARSAEMLAAVRQSAADISRYLGFEVAPAT